MEVDRENLHIEIWEECCGFHLEDSQGKVPVMIHRQRCKQDM